MSAKYVMQEMDDFHHAGETLLYPRMIINGSCGTDELARFVADNTTFNPVEVKGVLELLARGVARMMADGYSVKLDGIGLFTPSLSLKKGKEREEADGSGTRRNASSIEVGGVNFRPSGQLLLEVNRCCRLERAPGRFTRHVSKYTPEERLALAQRFLEQHPILTVGDYACLTGLSRTVAGEELRRWYKTPGTGIGISGRGSHRVYVRAGED